MPWQSVRQVTEIARLWMVRHGAFVSAGTVRQESDAACPSDPRDGFIDFPLLDKKPDLPRNRRGAKDEIAPGRVVDEQEQGYFQHHTPYDQGIAQQPPVKYRPGGAPAQSTAYRGLQLVEPNRAHAGAPRAARRRSLPRAPTGDITCQTRVSGYAKEEGDIAVPFGLSLLASTQTRRRGPHVGRSMPPRE